MECYAQEIAIAIVFSSIPTFRPPVVLGPKYPHI
jgi:hypothetical protein